MSTSRKIFDMRAFKMKQERALRLGYVNFIDEYTIKYAVDILSDIKRTFNNSAVIGKKVNLWADGLGIKEIKLIEYADNLDFQGKKFDLIIHALCLHSCNDPVGQLIQIRKALRPDGLMLTFFLGGETLRELRSSFESAEVKVENGISPRVAPMIEIRDAGNLLVRAGFNLNVADRSDLEVMYSSPINLLYDLRGMGETSIMVDRKKCFLRRSTLNECLEIYSTNHRITNGDKVKATFQILCLTGWAPADNQQKPLNPGSASHHFSQVLNTYEL